MIQLVDEGVEAETRRLLATLSPGDLEAFASSGLSTRHGRTLRLL
jgi:hypothetical protein